MLGGPICHITDPNMPYSKRNMLASGRLVRADVQYIPQKHARMKAVIWHIEERIIAYEGPQYAILKPAICHMKTAILHSGGDYMQYKGRNIAYYDP